MKSRIGMKRTALAVFASVIMLTTGCAPIAKNTVAKKIGDNSKAGVIEFQKGNLLVARSFFEAALKDAYSVDNLEEIVNALKNLADVSLQSGDLESARKNCEQALQYARTDQLTNTWFSLYLSYAKILDRGAGNPEEFAEAFSNFQISLKWAKKDEERSMVWNNLGIHFIRQKNWTEASNYIIKSRRINESKKNISALADNYFNLGDMYDQMGDLKAALESYLQALGYDKQAERPMSVFEDLKRLGSIYARLGNAEKSRYFYQRALNASRSLNLKEESAALEALLQ